MVTDTRSAYEKLTGPQRTFVDAVVERKSYTDAARIAYPKNSRPTVMGARMMKNPRIWDAIEEREVSMMREVGIRTEQILLEMAEVAFMPLTPQTASAKIKALQCLGLFKGIWHVAGRGREPAELPQTDDGTVLPNDSRVQVNIVRFTDGVMPMDETEDRHLRLISNAD